MCIACTSRSTFPFSTTREEARPSAALNIDKATIESSVLTQLSTFLHLDSQDDFQYYHRLSAVVSLYVRNSMGVCKSRHIQHFDPTRPSAKQLWKWAVNRIVYLLKLRRKWAHISKSIFQHPSHQSLFEGLERRQGKLIRKKFIY